MGYSHYWKIEHDINLQAFKELQTVAAMVAEASDAPVALRIQTAPLYLSITVEGMASDAHETFYLTPKAVKFDFCKTARKPYDEVVVGILDFAHKRGLLEFTSDGNPNDLAAGRRLVEEGQAGGYIDWDDVMFVHDQLEAKLGLKNSDWSEQVEVVSVDLVEDGPINWPEAGAEAAREVEDDKDEPEADVAGWYSKDLGAQAYRQGIHTKTYPNGATYRGYYLNDKRHGAGIKTHADGMHVHCVYEHGVKVGGYL